MITGNNPHTIESVNIATVNRHRLISGDVDTYSYNIGYYDDTAVKNRLNALEVDVAGIHQTDANFNYRLSLLENHEGDWATHSELGRLEYRVSKLENNPVGLTNSEMDDILES